MTLISILTDIKKGVITPTEARDMINNLLKDKFLSDYKKLHSKYLIETKSKTVTNDDFYIWLKNNL